MTLDDAARSHGLVTFFQPFYNLRTGALQGVEALARREAPDAQAELPTALQGESAGDIDLAVIDDALAHMTQWHSEDGPHLVVSVNLSSDYITRSNAVEDLLAAIARHDLVKDRLLLDVSVDIFRTAMSDPEARRRLQQVQQEEISLCLDRFTADDLDILDQAVAAPIDIIKLHPSQAALSRDDLAGLVDAIQERDLPVVAAGIETQEQLDLVRELGFEWAQGFLLGEPVNGDAVRSAPAVLDR
ncbi:MAG: EAL domain-containing protein [Mobilicoccus sp.]|nr:EAL domain-containing protein [Mobilicoccus sp.]